MLLFFIIREQLDLGEGLTLATDKQVIVYLEQKGTGYDIWVADPLYSQREVCLALNGREVQIAFPEGELTGSTAFHEYCHSPTF